MTFMSSLNFLLKTCWLASPFSAELPACRLEKAVWYSRFRRWCRANDCQISQWRPPIYEDLCNSVVGDKPIAYLEFGTHEGRSMRWWLGLNHHPASSFVGFDTFEGLPETWEGFSSGHFTTQGKLPEIADDRCSFVKGLFQETLPGFLKNYSPYHRQIVHVDSDLFSSAVFILNQMGPYLRPDDILIFDEFHVWMDEFRAFQIFLDVFQFDYTALYRSPDWSQVAIRLGCRKCKKP